MSLADIIGQDGTDVIQKAGQILIHIAGDTGVPETDHETRQVMVAEAMTKDFVVNQPEKSPAFFLHLGDVIYGSATDAFLSEFYRPYMHYPGKIVAIPGNHDGESSVKMTAFQKYFCATSATVPAIAGSIFRQTMTQPGVYWFMDAPFVQIIGLYSNSAENPGFISGAKPGPQQKNWLIKTLKNIKAARDKGTRKALLIVTHHPPYSSGGHSGSTQMLADIDDACKGLVMPDAFLSGHAHSIQRYTRKVPFNGKNLTIPYIVSGCGGHGKQGVAKVTKAPGSNPTYDFGYVGWGYTMATVSSKMATVSSKSLTLTSYGVDWDSSMNAIAKQVDTVTVPIS